MPISEIDNEKLGTSIDSTTSTTSTGVMSLLPLIAVTSLGAGAVQIHMNHYSNSSKRAAQVEMEERPSEYLQISETSFDNISYASVDYLDTQSEAEREFQILEGFIGKILHNSKPQPGDIKSKMYNNIDDLLIGWSVIEKMELREEIHRHLPTYLNVEDKKKLFDEIKSFPSNIDSRIYSSHPELSKEIIYQGDIIANQPIMLLPETNLKNTQVLVISNTCDIDLKNENIKSPRVVYCPLISFANYEKIAYESYEKEQPANDHLNSIRKQKITDMFYLPAHGDIKESIVLFNAASNYRMKPDHAKKMLENRIISLGNYGFMLFLVKLSIHFTRIEEGVNRG